MRRPLPGDLVMRRVEWFLDSHLIGTLIGYLDESTCVVMWNRENGSGMLCRHFIDELRVVDSDNEEERLKRRRCIST
jgi:hypothetical protein